MKRIPPKLALPWILEEDWPQWQAVDRGVPTYEKWVELFDANLKIAESRGWPYERIPVRPDPFSEWCKTHQRTAGKFDRSLYALEILRGRPAKEPQKVEVKASTETLVETSRQDLPKPTTSREINAPAV